MINQCIKNEQHNETIPIADENLPDDLKSEFDVIFNEIYIFERVDFTPTAADYDNLNHRIQSIVNKNPILVRVFSKDIICWSLLTTICEKVHNNLSHPTIKYLIEKNPIALLWKWGDIDHPSTPIKCIAMNHCTLMPWIAENFQWVLDHPKCLNIFPHNELVHRYTDGRCHADVVQQFFEHYPQGLRQEDKLMQDGLPLFRILCGWDNCDVHLFKWMAEKYPTAVLHGDRYGHIPLHMACISLACMSLGLNPPEEKEHLKEICMFLIANHSRGVRMKSRHDRCLPIHYLVKRCNCPFVQEVIVQLLREYPESINISSKNKLCPAPKSSYFVQQVGLVLDTEKKLQSEIQSLTNLSEALLDAASCSKSDLWMSLPTIIQSWSKSRCQACQERLDSNELDDEICGICKVHEGDDPQESDDEESDGLSSLSEGVDHGESEDNSDSEALEIDYEEWDDDSYGIDVIVLAMNKIT